MSVNVFYILLLPPLILNNGFHKPCLWREYIQRKRLQSKMMIQNQIVYLGCRHLLIQSALKC